MAKTENCPAAKGGTKAARLCAASKLIKISAHLQQRPLRTPCTLSLCAANINFCEKDMLARHMSPDGETRLQDASKSVGVHALPSLLTPCSSLEALHKCSRGPFIAGVL